jgi:hypothetical protein
MVPHFRTQGRSIRRGKVGSESHLPVSPTLCVYLVHQYLYIYILHKTVKIFYTLRR